MKIIELREKRAKLIADARALLEKAEKEKRSLTAEENGQYETMLTDSEKINGEIRNLERLEALESQEEPISRRRAGREDTQPEGPVTSRATDQSWREGMRPALREWLEYRESQRSPEQRSLKASAFRRLLRREDMSPEELRSLQMDSLTGGGYLTMPEEFIARLIMAIDDAVFVRQRATVIPVTSSASLGEPALGANPEDADWTSEVGSADEDTAMTVEKRELHPHPLSKLIKVSMKLMRVGGAVNPEALVRDRLAYKFGITEEKGFLTGTGANQPLGVFTASNLGISTGRDVSTDNTTTSMTFDGLKNAQYTLKSQYWANAEWIFHRTALKQISKLKDGEGRYIWETSVQTGQPDRLLNFPTNMSEYAPSTFTTGLYVGLLGDLRYYHIADSMQFEIQRLNELFARTNQIGFIGRQEVDGMPVLEEAFVRVKLA